MAPSYIFFRVLHTPLNATEYQCCGSLSSFYLRQLEGANYIKFSPGQTIDTSIIYKCIFRVIQVLTRSRWWLKRLRAEPPPASQHPVRFSGHKFWQFLRLLRDLIFVTWSEGHVPLKVGASHSKSATRLFWCPWVFCKYRYNVSNLAHDITWPSQWEVREIYGRNLLALCNCPDKFCDHRHCKTGDIMFLIHRVTLCDHMFKGLCEFIGGIISR